MSSKAKNKRIPRPLNAFMLFANDNRASFRRKHPGETNSRISVRLGEAWKALNGKEKTKYYQLSKKAEIEHRNMYPNYTYCPNEARSHKRTRREERSVTLEDCSKSDDTEASTYLLQKSCSSEACCNLSKSSSDTSVQEVEWKQNSCFRGCSATFQNNLWRGHGDQMRHFPVPFPPHCVPPFPYPRFPCWDLRPHPFISSQYNRMPFFPPHPMMYTCPPPLHPPSAATSLNPPAKVDTGTAEGFLSEMPYYPIPSEVESDLMKTEQVSTDGYQQTNTMPAGEFSSSASQGSEPQTLGAIPFNTRHQTAESPTPGKDQHKLGIASLEHSMMQPVPSHHDEPGVGPEESLVSTYTYGLTQQTYSQGDSQEPVPFAHHRSTEPEGKTYADLSNGRVELINVPASAL